MDEWFPIETAPLRQWVRLWSPWWVEPRTTIGRRDHKSHWWTVKSEGSGLQWTLRGYDPTLWQPLPEPPKEDEHV
jgi:hypothetical protein